MAFGNNRKGTQSRAHFQLAGGSIIKFRHPYLIGQIDLGLGTQRAADGTYATSAITPTAGTALDEIDISASVKLEGRYFEANPNQDSSKQVVLIDGSTVTICNKLLNGTITLPVIKTTGLVGSGDFLAACHLIQSIGDTVGGILTKTDFINGKVITKLFYGVTVQKCPVDVSEGNDVAVNQVTLLYAGWIEAQSNSASENQRKIWAVGNAKGLSAYFSPYPIQEGNTRDSAYAGIGLVGSPNSDNTTADENLDNAQESTESNIQTAGYDATVISGVTEIS